MSLGHRHLFGPETCGILVPNHGLNLGTLQGSVESYTLDHEESPSVSS